MHILLTDILTCPRCGPSFGLILLADEVADRRVRTGRLGCANCREQYPVRDGVVLVGTVGGSGDEGLPESGGPEAGDDEMSGRPGGGSEVAHRLAALMGVTEGPGYLLLAGPAGVHAAGIADLVPGVEVVAANAPMLTASSTGDGGVSHVRVSGPTLPFGSSRMAGVVLSGAAADEYLEEGLRVLGPLGRLVLEPAPAAAGERIEAAGLHILAHADETLVAGRLKG
jgi:uncharacterized protein YbaR (Trm112 family)